VHLTGSLAEATSPLAPAAEGLRVAYAASHGVSTVESGIGGGVSATAPAPTGTGRNASANNRGSLSLVLRIWPHGADCSGPFDATPCGFQESATGPDLGLYAVGSYSLMRPPRTGRRLIRSWERSATGWSGRGGRRWRLRWAPSVVVRLVLGEDCSQMPRAEDQHAVGDLGPGGEHEPFRISVRARASGRDLTAWIPASARTASNDAGELPGPVPDQEPEVRGAITQIRQQVADLLHGPGTVRFAVIPRMYT